MPELKTAVVDRFLEEFSRQLAPGVHAVLLWDNAPYHVSGDLVASPRLGPPEFPVASRPRRVF